jgi:hypothetical protein
MAPLSTALASDQDGGDADLRGAALHVLKREHVTRRDLVQHQRAAPPGFP